MIAVFRYTLGKMIGEIHMTQDQRRRWEKRCLETYGELI